MTREEALYKLQAQCSLKEICISEAEDKLRKWKIEASDFSGIISALTEAGYIDERRYVKAFVNDKSKLSKWGAIKIRQALSAKKISNEIIAEVCSTIDSEQSRTALAELLTKKLKSIKSSDSHKTFASLMRYGTSRGFEYDEVYSETKKITKLEREYTDENRTLS